jgi:hypothetical protein
LAKSPSRDVGEIDRAEDRREHAGPMLP